MTYSLENGKFEAFYQGRRAITTDGTLLQFLTQEQVFSRSITFPDADKVRLDAFRYSVARNGGGFRAVGNTRAVVGAHPQEWSEEVVLGDAPKGADLFVGRVELTRTKAPTHPWIGQSIIPFLPQGMQIQVNGGSMIVEAVAGLARAMTIDVVGGKLMLHMQHSVGPGAGNFGSFGTMPPAAPRVNGEFAGGENRSASGRAAMPVFWRDSAPYYKEFERAITGTSTVDGDTVASFANSHRVGNANAAAYDDPTDYSSIYSLTVRGRFGRRS